MRPTLHVEASDSIALAAVRLRENGVGILPVLRERRLVGVVTEGSLAKALGGGCEATDSIEPWLEQPKKIRPYQTGAEALRQCEDGSVLVVADERDTVVGLIAASDLWPRRRVPVKPPAVGGMATPFGVYLTTGGVSAGVPPWALMFTGAAMFALFFVAGIASDALGALLLARGMKESIVGPGVTILATVFFLAFMRLVPLSGTHGAEHQVVHAIEREEDLVPSVVRRMPRVHPRCGTNLAVGALLFLGLSEAEWAARLIPDHGLRALLALVVAAMFWRKIGGFLQQYATTKRPSDRQLAGAIRAGEDLLQRYATASVAVPPVWQRLWNSGMLQVIAGSSLAAVIVTGISKLFHWDLGL